MHVFHYAVYQMDKNPQDADVNAVDLIEILLECFPEDNSYDSQKRKEIWEKREAPQKLAELCKKH